jgi:anti-sigma factor RsiW
MQKHSDETLVAYLDGELDDTERREVEAWLDAEPSVRDRLLALAESASAVRAAFADIVNEPVPDRLIAAARGETASGEIISSEAEIVAFRPKIAGRTAAFPRRWGAGLAMAAGLCGLVIGGALTYFGNGILVPANPTERQVQTASLDNWLENAAGDYKLIVNPGGDPLVDVPANGDTGETLQKISQNMPQQQVRLPDLKPWGLNFRGARLVVVEGRPAAQLVYTTDNKAIGPLALIIGSSKEPDLAPTQARRQDLNLLYWRHAGRASVLVGQSEIGYLWGIANDVAWQLDAI